MEENANIVYILLSTVYSKSLAQAHNGEISTRNIRPFGGGKVYTHTVVGRQKDETWSIVLIYLVEKERFKQDR